MPNDAGVRVSEVVLGAAAAGVSAEEPKLAGARCAEVAAAAGAASESLPKLAATRSESDAVVASAVSAEAGEPKAPHITTMKKPISTVEPAKSVLRLRRIGADSAARVWFLNTEVSLRSAVY